MRLDWYHPNVKYMRLAIGEAVKNHREAGEHPIGAVLVRGKEVVAQSGNRCHLDCDPLAHAEIVVIRQGCSRLGTKRLDNCVLYVTHEPCPMCAWVMVMARLKMLIWGTDSTDAAKVLRVPQEFRIQKVPIDPIFSGGDGSDHGIHYFPHRYPEICHHLLLLCASQQPLDFGPPPFDDRVAVESRVWCRANLRGSR